MDIRVAFRGFEHQIDMREFGEAVPNDISVKADLAASVHVGVCSACMPRKLDFATEKDTYIYII